MNFFECSISHKFSFSLQDGENHMTEEQSGTNETQYNNFIRFGAKTNPTTPRNVQNNESGMYEDGNFSNGHDVFFAAPGGPVSSQSNHERLPEYWNHNMRKKVYFLLFLFDDSTFLCF